MLSRHERKRALFTLAYRMDHKKFLEILSQPQEKQMPNPRKTRRSRTSRTGRRMPDTNTAAGVAALALSLPGGDVENNPFDRTRNTVTAASKEYIDSRDAWKRAVAELEATSPCSGKHPDRVTAAILAYNNFLASAERMQEVCRKS